MKVNGITIQAATGVDAIGLKPVDLISMITLKAPAEAAADDSESRPPVDLTLCIDRSGSMGSLMPLVIETIEFVVSQLTCKDRLCLVQYDDSIDTIMKFTNMDSQGKLEACRRANLIQARGGTNLADGLFRGMQECSERPQPNDIASVLLFTDGQANTGITDQNTIVELMKTNGWKNASAYVHSSPFNCQSASVSSSTSLTNKFGGFGIPFSFRSPFSKSKPDQKEEGKENTETREGDQKVPMEDEESAAVSQSFTVNTFGFGQNHNEGLLRSISEAGNGMYFYIENRDVMADAFIDCVGGLLSIVAQDMHLVAQFPEGIQVTEVLTPFPTTKTIDGTGKTTCSIKIKDMQSEETRDVLFRLTLPATTCPQYQHLFHARVTYTNMLATPPSTTFNEVDCKVARKSEGTFTAVISKDVDKQVNRISVAKALKEASAFADRGDLQQARSKLDTMIQGLQASPTYSEGATKDLESACAKARAGLRDQSSWVTSGSKFTCSSMGGFTQQRFQGSAKVALTSSYHNPEENQYENLKTKQLRANYKVFKSADRKSVV